MKAILYIIFSFLSIRVDDHTSIIALTIKTSITATAIFKKHISAIGMCQFKVSAYQCNNKGNYKA